MRSLFSMGFARARPLVLWRSDCCTNTNRTGCEPGVVVVVVIIIVIVVVLVVVVVVVVVVVAVGKVSNSMSHRRS